jgi:SnoaL-like domain
MAKLTIEDRLALQDLIAAYSWALDTGDADGLVACFTADAQMIEEVFEDPDIWTGHDGIRGLARHYFNAPGFPGRQHHVTQTQFTPRDDDTCAMRSFAFVTECKDEPPYVLRFTGWYEDVAVKGSDGQWRFSSRKVRLWDGEVLKRFPGHGQWVPRKRPESLIIRR